MAIWEKLFSKITFKNYPNTSTPINADNLNKMTDAIDGIDDRVVELNSNLDTKQNAITGGASSITNADLMPLQALVSGQDGKVAVSSVTATEVGYLKDVTSPIQTQFDTINSNLTSLTNTVSGKQPTIIGGATTITDNNLTANRTLISNSSGKVAVSDVTSTELGYLDGVTSKIQTQFDNMSNAINNKKDLIAYDKESQILFSYKQYGSFNNPIMRIDGTTNVELIPNTGQFKIIACEPYLYNNSVWKLKVSFYADGSIIDMFFTQS